MKKIIKNEVWTSREQGRTRQKKEKKTKEKQIQREENRKTGARDTQGSAQDDLASTTYFPK